MIVDGRIRVDVEVEGFEAVEGVIGGTAAARGIHGREEEGFTSI